MKCPKYAVYGKRSLDTNGKEKRRLDWWVVWQAHESGIYLGDPERTFVCLPSTRRTAETTAALLNTVYGRIQPDGMIPPRPMNYGNEWYRQLLKIAGERIQKLQNHRVGKGVTI